MGEFLLSILGFNEANELVYKRRVHRANFKVNQPVAIAYPNPKRKTTARYYRIYNRFYAVDVLHELVRSQDPNVIDQNGYTPKHREYEDANMMADVSQGKSYEEIGEFYGWHPEAVKLALVRHKNRQYALRQATPTLDDDERLPTPNLTEEQIAKRAELLAQWD
jgi:hypothetical protein